jgi:hypothetical protein
MMADKTIFDYTAAFLGGGSIVAVGGWIHSNWSARRAREVEALREQLRSLYGPLYFFTRQNEELLQLHQKVEDARYKFFEGRGANLDTDALESLSKQHTRVIDLKNTYSQRLIDNNKRVMDLIEKNWHLVDASDVETLAQFQVDHTRYLVESEGNGAAGIPFNVLQDLGSIPVARPDLMACARKTFERKRARLVELTGVSEGV